MKAYTTFTTISGRTLKVNSNLSKRHFTIKTESGVYRTNRLTQEEFDSLENNTANDWQDFLNYEDYYRVR